MEKLIESLTRHEGRVNKLYLDSKGNLTGGIGHYFKVGSYLPDEVVDILFKTDVATAVSKFNKIDINLRKKLNAERRRVIVEMIFNMGLHGVLGFEEMWICIGNDDFDGASREIMESKYALDVGDGPGGKFDRAEELAGIMRKGE